MSIKSWGRKEAKRRAQLVEKLAVTMFRLAGGRDPYHIDGWGSPRWTQYYMDAIETLQKQEWPRR